MSLKQYKLDKEQRTFFFLSSCILWCGIWLSGFAVHWLLYIPPSFFLGAALTGYCFGLVIVKMVFEKR